MSREGGHVLQMQRRRLLLAFAEVVAREGLEGASVGCVCGQAGVSRRTFYDLFDDREACLLATFDAAIERARESVVPAWEGEDGWQDSVRAGLTALLDLFEREPALAHVCVTETLKAGPAVAERRRQVLDALAQAVDEGRSGVKRGASPPPLTAQSTVGGVLSVIHAHLLEGNPSPLTELSGPLMSMIVHPYLGPVAAQRELDRPCPPVKGADNHDRISQHVGDPFRDLSIRITLRTARVLATVAAQPGASNRQVGDGAGIPDQGQTSKLLHRLERAGLLANHGSGHSNGEPNAWGLTQRGEAIQRVMSP